MATCWWPHGVLCASLYTVVAKRFDDGSDALSLTTWQFTVATAIAVPVAMTRWAGRAEAAPVAVAPRFWLAAGLVGVAGFGVSFLLFNLVIVRVDAGWAAVVLNLIPLFALASAVIFLREGLTPGDAIGAVLIGASVLYFVRADSCAAVPGMSAVSAGPPDTVTGPPGPGGLPGRPGI